MKKEAITTQQWLKFIDREKLQTFQDLFSKSFGGSMAFFSLDDEPLTVWSRESLFCRALQKETLSRCEESAKTFKASLSTGRVKVYVCPFGITCLYCPVFFNGQPIAYAYCGGIIYPDSKLDKKLRLKYHLPVLNKNEVDNLALLLESALNLLDADYTSLAERPSSPVSRFPHNQRDERISAREWEIIELLCHGLSNKQIAARLFISETTVKTHVSNILAKVGLHDRMQIIIHYYGRFEKSEDKH